MNQSSWLPRCRNLVHLLDHLFSLPSFNHVTLPLIYLQAVPIKIGAWGGDGGTEFDVTEPPKRLESMTVRAGDSVDSIGFSYVDDEGQKHSVGPFGGTGGQPTTVLS